MIYFETERLIFRNWCEDDLQTFKQMNEDERVMKYFLKAMTHEETQDFYQHIIKEFSQYGYGLYAIETKENKEFIGFIGFHWARFKADFTPCVEIGWRLKYSAWGKGYATEGARACLKYGLETLGFEKVYSFTSTINYPSENVMKKIGLVKDSEFEHPNLPNGHPLKRHLLYCNKQ